MLIYEGNLYKKIEAISQLWAEKITLPHKRGWHTDICFYRVALLLKKRYKQTESGSYTELNIKLQVLKTNENLTWWRYYAARRRPPPANNDCDDRWSHLPHDSQASSCAGERQPQNCRRQCSPLMRSAIHGAWRDSETGPPQRRTQGLTDRLRCVELPKQTPSLFMYCIIMAKSYHMIYKT